MLSVGAGNRPDRPDNPRELRKTWNLTWLVVAGLVLFALLFFAVLQLGQETQPLQETQEQSLMDPLAPVRPPSVVADRPAIGCQPAIL